MSSDRRIFLKTIVAGAAGAVIWGRVMSAVPAALFYKTLPGRKVEGEETIPRFPFFEFAEKFNIGEYIPKDQGGKFIQEALLGTEDDLEITSLIRNGLIKKIYGDPVGWQKYEENEVEKSVWLNRLYFLPSFARQFYITGDSTYLTDMMGIIRQWISDNPRLPDSHVTTYNWRDMQVAWRSIHFSWCYYLAGDAISAEDKDLISESLKEHASILLSGFGQAPLNEFNHQSHGALAMLYLGVLFPGFENAGQLVDKAVTILSHHLDKAFYGDGGNVEQMFGYYPFEAHIFRDAFLLCSANGIEPPRGSVPMLIKMSAFLAAVARPDATMPQVNDSFEMPTASILETLGHVTATGIPERENLSRLFPDTQVGVIRAGGESGWYLLANPAMVIGSHAHAGRLGFELWYNGKPLLTDSGCCNYDDPALISWYRRSEAHNTVIIDGKGDMATSGTNIWVPRRETLNRITDMNTGEQVQSVVMVSPEGEESNHGVRWTRRISIIKESIVIISDIFETDGSHTYDINLHLPPGQASCNFADKRFVAGGMEGFEIITAVPGNYTKAWLSDGMVSRKGASTKAAVAHLSIDATGSISSHLVVVPLKGKMKATSIRSSVSGNAVRLKVKESGGTAMKLLLKDSGIEILH